MAEELVVGHKPSSCATILDSTCEAVQRKAGSVATLFPAPARSFTATVSGIVLMIRPEYAAVFQGLSGVVHDFTGRTSAPNATLLTKGGLFLPSPAVLLRCRRSYIIDSHFSLLSREDAFPHSRLAGLKVRRGYGYAFVAYPLNIAEAADVQPLRRQTSTLTLANSLLPASKPFTRVPLHDDPSQTAHWGSRVASAWRRHRAGSPGSGRPPAGC